MSLLVGNQSHDYIHKKWKDILSMLYCEFAATSDSLETLANLGVTKKHTYSDDLQITFSWYYMSTTLKASNMYNLYIMVYTLYMYMYVYMYVCGWWLLIVG